VVIDHEGVKTTVQTTAVVRDKLGLLLLDPTGSQSLMVTGNGSVTVTGDGGAAVVDSSAGDAAFVTGNGVVSAGDFDVIDLRPRERLRKAGVLSGNFWLS
jgi:hypothetical protein